MKLRICCFILLLMITKVTNAKNYNIFDYNKSFQFPNHKSKEATFVNHSEDKNSLLISKLPKESHENLDIKKQPNALFPEFRLHKKTISYNPELESKYVVYQKLTEILNERQPSYFDERMDNNYPNEALFNHLKSELNSLCCNKHEVEKNNEEPIPSFHVKPLNLNIFLVFNEEIKGPVAEDGLVIVDPNSLSKNSTVFPLGTIDEYLDSDDLKALMSRISQELNKVEYLPTLSKLANGQIEGPNAAILKYINHPQTRRYIKPHRCNYQAPLSKVFGDTRWIICTGYININIPSIYDR